MYDFKDKVALITGASGDIGSAIAKLFNKYGVYVIISGSNENKLSTLSSELDDNHRIINQDLSSNNAAQNIMSQIDKLDYLICNAGATYDNLIMVEGCSYL